MDFGNRPSAESYIEGFIVCRLPFHEGNIKQVYTFVSGILQKFSYLTCAEIRAVFGNFQMTDVFYDDCLWDALNYIVPSSCFRPFKRKSLPNKSCNQLFCFQKILFLYLRIENQIRSFNNPAEIAAELKFVDCIPHLVVCSNTQFGRVISYTNAEILRTSLKIMHPVHIGFQSIRCIGNFCIPPGRRFMCPYSEQIFIIFPISEPASHLHQDIICASVAVEITDDQSFQCQSS